MSESSSNKLKWHEWNPGLHNGDLMLQDVIDTLPAAKADEIPWLVRLFENPASPIAFPGAINLTRHDALHVLLGRGLRNQDEAFVIGFTMGCSSHLLAWQIYSFRWIITHLYPAPYKFSVQDLMAFDLGFGLGRSISASDLDEFPFEKYNHSRLKDLRYWLGINVNKLHALYRFEALLIANTQASHRLDTHDKPWR
ncbi:MAG TPA: hypothetical protein VLF09_04030 [Cellvibrio sp.]|nr:hypothetical protein [Cellvibrio sp.]